MFRRSIKRILRFPFEHLNMSVSRNFFIFLLPIMTSVTVIFIVLPGPFNVVFGVLVFMPLLALWFINETLERLPKFGRLFKLGGPI